MSHKVEMYFWVSWQGWIFSNCLICDFLGRFWLILLKKTLEWKFFWAKNCIFSVCWFATIRSFVRFSLVDQWKLPIISFFDWIFFLLLFFNDQSDGLKSSKIERVCFLVKVGGFIFFRGREMFGIKKKRTQNMHSS